MKPLRTQGDLCEASAPLPPRLRQELLRAHPTLDRTSVMDDLVCAFELHEGDEHFGVLYDDFPDPGRGALWTRWRNGEEPEGFQLRPDCGDRSMKNTACGHFSGHPGPHTWADEVPRRVRTRPSRLHQEPQAVTWAREKAGLTKRALADRIGISEQLVGEIESGWRTASPANLARMAAALNCPLVILERRRTVGAEGVTSPRPDGQGKP